MTAELLYKDLAAFYAADERRVESEERIFGELWRIDDWVPWRLRWIEATGEVVATPTLPGGERLVAVLGVVEGLAAVETLLDGWEKVCGRAGSLGWVNDRLREFSDWRAGVAQRSAS